VSGNGKYQRMPPLRDEELSALRADITRRGVLIPIEKDEDGNTLDGHNREAIARDLGIPCPEVVRHFDSEQAKREHVIKINLARRHLDPVRWGQAFALLLEERGIETGQGSSAAKQHSQSATIADSAAEFGVSERTARSRLRKARQYEALPADVRADVDAGELTVPQATRQVERQERREALAAAATTNGAPAGTCPWRIVQGDCRAQRGITERPRLIFADPPYNVGVDYGDGPTADRMTDEAYLQFTSEWLAVCHARLADDGTLWVLIGDEYAAEMGCLLREHGFHRRAWVKWYETFGVNCANNFNRCSRHLFYCVKDPGHFVFHPEVVTRPSDRQTKYGDARADPGGKLWDDVWQISRLVGTAKERIPDFPTQLPLALLRPIVGCSSDPGDLVLDPFCGSGTTGVAAVGAGRRFVGIDRQQRFVDLATLRMKGTSHASV